MAEHAHKISIVTASFNQGAFIDEALRSVAAQGHPDVEHIVVDNCSTDETPRVLARYPHLRVICEKDRGQSDALNKGFRVATGDIVGWLNADDKYLSGCFDAVLDAFARDPELDIIYGDYRFVDVTGRPIRVRKEIPFNKFILKYLHVLYIPTTACFFRRKVFADGNFLDISYHYAMDYEFFLRLAAAGYRFGHVPRVMADFRWHASAKSSREVLRPREEMKRALLVHDTFLAELGEPWQTLARFVLTALARGERYFLKLVRGAYWG